MVIASACSGIPGFAVNWAAARDSIPGAMSSNVIGFAGFSTG